MKLQTVLLFVLGYFPLNAQIIPIAQVQEGDWQDELQHIDKELGQLQDLKNKYKASAARHEDEAIRWQFQQNLKQESRRAYRQVDLDREMIQQIDARINYLEGRKAQLLKEHPNAIKKSS